MNNFIFKAFLIFIFMAVPLISLFAQPGDPGGGDPDVPIDGGASLLAAAGVGYGAKKLRDYVKAKKEKQTESEESDIPGLN